VNVVIRLGPARAMAWVTKVANSPFGADHRLSGNYPENGVLSGLATIGSELAILAGIWSGMIASACYRGLTGERTDLGW
jgi:hypothetical protein